MIAFVLSGGGNRGPLAVGALRALIEAGIQPDLVVGTSAGAINATHIAIHGATLASIDGLANTWSRVTRQTVYPGNVLTLAWRFVRRAPSLYRTHKLRAFIAAQLPPGVTTFAHAQLPLYVTAVDLLTSRLFVFGVGERGRSAPLVDAVLASAAVPVIHPPVCYRNLQLVDGGILANVPASIAVQQGATEIYAINVSHGEAIAKPARGLLDVLDSTIDTITVQALLRDLKHAEADVTVDLHHIHVEAFEEISFRDFTQSAAMVRVGYEKTLRYLERPQPRTVEPRPAQSVAPTAAPPVWGDWVGNAVEFVPPGRS